MYVDVLNKNPNIPFFILDEIHKNPEKLSAVFLNAGLPLNRVFEMIQQAREQGLIRPVDPRQIIVNMISLSVFPVVGRNIILPVIFQNDKDSFEKFLESRKTEVADFIIHSIKQPKD